MSERIKIGIIGANVNAGDLREAAALTNFNMHSLTALAVGANEHYLPDLPAVIWSEMLSRDDLPGVAVLSGPGRSTDLVCEALEAGKFVVCPSLAGQDTNALKRVADAAGPKAERFVSPGQLANTPAGSAAIKEIHDTEMGELFSLYLAVRASAAQAGDAVVDLLPKALEFVDEVVGLDELHRVSAHVSRNNGPVPAARSVVALLRLSKGQIVTVETSYCLAARVDQDELELCDLEVIASRDTLRARLGGPDIEIVAARSSVAGATIAPNTLTLALQELERAFRNPTPRADVARQLKAITLATRIEEASKA